MKMCNAIFIWSGQYHLTIFHEMCNAIFIWSRQYHLTIALQWSFGVTCWEVFSGGRTPYPAVNPTDLPRLLEEGMRLDYPSNAANAPEMYVFEIHV